VITPRRALALTVLTVFLLPTGPASASIDGSTAVRTLATDAADLLAEEVALVAMATPDATSSPTELDEVRSQLQSIDAQGHSVLVQLHGLGVELTPAIETALDRLPQTEDGAAASVSLVPQPFVYEAAIDDLLRIAATPAAVAPVGNGSGGPSYALLLVATVSLLILGGAALTNTLWRRPDTEPLESPAWSDGLTGLANRRRLDHDLDVNRMAGPTSVIMIDVDHFRGVNDAYGPQVGDDILKRLGVLFSHQVRLDDVVYRSGGEEFCVLLPGAEPTEARLVAKRIVEAARSINLPNGANITVSVGVADGATGTLDEAVENADRALTLAKQQGRDRAVHADEHDLVTA
jgi:diguanylate cyclase (GGDEF)-like protein